MNGTQVELADAAKLADHELVQMLLIRLDKKFPTPPVPVQAIDDEVEFFKAAGLYEDLDEAEWSTIGKIVKSRVKITMEEGTTLAAPTYVDWLADRHDDINWQRWVAYKQLLFSKGFAPSVVGTLDQATKEILNCLGDPSREGKWKRRGLVIGDVQSGKTATYLGVVNRAADAGYKLVILLAGGTEALRKQTQFRVDEGLLGRDTARESITFGVGKWQTTGFVGAQAMTTQATDFRKTSKQATSILVDANSPTPLVFIVKKNKTALENVRDWIANQLDGASQLDVPMLLVDDESDYASVNTKDQDSPTVINALIREVLALATQTSYLAFTATPFANVFIDHETEDETLGDDLFPSDYIRTLEAPSNYVGSGSYFGTEDENDSARLVDLTDADDYFPYKHKSQLQVPGLPDSLHEALRTFVVASALREQRGDSSPRSMLVNVSRFKSVQAQVHALIETEFEHIRNAVELHAVGSVGGAQHRELARLRQAYTHRYAGDLSGWEALIPFLKSAVNGVSVRLINSDRVKKASDLAEVETDRMIAVGGDVLSRGLTLEGLTVSYFHRLVGASDTLLQMARWFGYRPGYDDLCRVWIPDEVADQFRYVAGIVDDLRAQLRAMKKQNLTPKDFGLRVRMHPESLLITARNKMKAAEAKAWTVNVAGAKNLETVRLSSNISVIKDNHQAVRKLVEVIEAGHPDATWSDGTGTIRAVHGVDHQSVADFLDSYVAFVGDPFFADSALAEFIRNTKTDRFKRWTVGFVPGNGSEVTLTETLSFKRPIRAVASSAAVRIGDAEAIPLRVSGSSSRLAGSTDVARAGEEVDHRLKEPEVYSTLAKPVLLLYLVEPRLKETSGETSGMSVQDATGMQLLESIDDAGLEHLVGVKVGIPGTPGEKGAEVKYMLNSVALGAWQGAAFEEPVGDDLSDVDGADDE